jgi:hypothetical protein
MEADTRDKKQRGGLCGEHPASVGHSASANEAPLPEPDVIIYQYNEWKNRILSRYECHVHFRLRQIFLQQKSAKSNYSYVYGMSKNNPVPTAD